ncbi:MAG: hypothetical protein FWB91_08445 [Defluviitaleaceae bacterium]|nr:hypothetical protein [Defluviitaleaceae bacterium]
MNNEKMRVLDLLEAGKISTDEAAKLLEVLGANPRFVSKETRENMEEKLQQFAKDVNKFAKDVGSKMQDFYREVEPKVKKASQTALEKAASALDNLACSINESLEKKEAGCCEGEEPKDDTPIPN